MQNLQIHTHKTQITLIAGRALEIKITSEDETLKLTTETLPIHFASLISLYCTNRGQTFTCISHAGKNNSYIMSLNPLRARLTNAKTTVAPKPGDKGTTEKKSKTKESTKATPASTSITTTSTPAAMLRFESMKGNRTIKMLLNIYDLAKIRTWACMSIPDGDVDLFGYYIIQSDSDGLNVKTGGRPLVKIPREDCVELSRALSLVSMGVPAGYKKKNVSLYYDKSQNIPVINIGGIRSAPELLTLHRLMLHCERYVYLDAPKPVDKKKTAPQVVVEEAKIDKPAEEVAA